MIDVLAAVALGLALAAVIAGVIVGRDVLRWEAIAGGMRILLHGRRPHRVDKPGENRALPPAWGTWEAALERVPASVRDEFLPASERVDRRNFATGGVLLVPDDVEVTDLAHGPTMLRVSRTAAGQIRFHRGGYVSSGEPIGQLPQVRPGPGPGGQLPARPPREPDPLLWRRHEYACNAGGPCRCPMPEPTVGPSGPSGVSSSRKPTVTLAEVLAANARVDARRIADEARQMVPRETGRLRSPHRP